GSELTALGFKDADVGQSGPTLSQANEICALKRERSVILYTTKFRKQLWRSPRIEHRSDKQSHDHSQNAERGEI
ncbi:MAG: hypothetical protein ACT6WE_29580, partial [Shinella sp.]|uniref:hypothetical protein n=1 Tax=Shinella sp. TaxID=1870904 RepID=UPI004037229A